MSVRPAAPPLLLTRALADSAQTIAVAASIGAAAAGRDVFALTGPLGAGKTHFVKGLARGLSVPADQVVVSPTFVLVREYAGRLRVYHVDAYRLRHADELTALGFDEMLADDGAVLAIEWADHVGELLPPHAVWLDLAYAASGGRELRIRGSSPRAAALAAAAAPPLVPRRG
ncbi:MAG: tRNA threonylcarbamoyladenosine biosynthesis protein TsaE [Phycisphaerae bacterium]|nr:tRNA threonylcarbamoyladenosine biosynthesis protein TsaE [Phycisphaerae bacterium]